MANLRLSRFLGDRLAHQAIMCGRRIDCGSLEGRLICDEIAPADRMDAALVQAVEDLTSSGIVSAVGNRRQFRIGQEPLDLFRRYLALYAKEQAYCHFSDVLIILSVIGARSRGRASGSVFQVTGAFAEFERTMIA